MALLHYVTEHNQQVIGALVVVIIVTAILLLMRTLSQENNVSETAKSRKGSDLDLGAIEAAFKRVLVAQGGASVGSRGGPLLDSAAGGAQGQDLGEPSDRDSKVQELAREIDRLTAELADKSAATGFGGTTSTPLAGAAPGSNEAVDALHLKIAELEGRLSEYEIIEDDIADLSRFKEENAELRGELEALKRNTTVNASGPSAQDASAASNLNSLSSDSVTTPDANSIADEMFGLAADDLESNLEPNLESALAEPVLHADAVDDSTGASSFVPAQIAATEKITPGEVVINESESSLEIILGTKPEASVLDGSLDTEKMLSEVAGLAESGASDDNALSEELDTDKLIAEMGSMSASPPAAPSPSLPSLLDEGKPVFEDDLLAEFKESTDGGQG